MKDRIIQILEHFNLNQATFAQRLGVSKASVSHVLSPSGRGTKFGDDTLNKIVELFGVNKNWLLTGNGSMLEGNTQPRQNTFDFSQVVESRNKNNTAVDGINVKETINSPIKKNVARPERSSNSRHSKDIEVNKEKAISRIVVFYNDGSFVEYKPDLLAQY